MAVITRSIITAPSITLKRYVGKQTAHQPPILLLGAGIVSCAGHGAAVGLFAVAGCGRRVKGVGDIAAASDR